MVTVVGGRQTPTAGGRAGVRLLPPLLHPHSGANKTCVLPL